MFPKHIQIFFTSSSSSSSSLSLSNSDHLPINNRPSSGHQTISTNKHTENSLRMDGRFTSPTLILLLFITHSLTPGSSIADPTEKQGKYRAAAAAAAAAASKSSIHQKDITTPITTVPTINIPTINPTSNPDDSTGTVSPAITTPSFTPATTATGGSSWCIASLGASQAALQLALDYACGMGGADCAAIQTGGKCYNPNSVRDHASYAFNSYYQKNPLPNSCNFGGTALITNTNPSSGTCEYPSTSTSSSVLNTTNSSGSTVFGAVPSGPSTSSAPKFRHFPQFFFFLLLSTNFITHR